MTVRGWQLNRYLHKFTLSLVTRLILCLKVLPLVHSGLAKFCSNVATWMQKVAADGPYDYSDYNSNSKVMLSFLELKLTILW